MFGCLLSLINGEWFCLVLGNDDGGNGDDSEFRYS